MNGVFATLLRTLGYRVSELGSRAYKALGNDPTKHEAGWLWGTITHEVLVVDWPESKRYIVDAMWGPWVSSSRRSEHPDHSDHSAYTALLAESGEAVRLFSLRLLK